MTSNNSWMPLAKRYAPLFLVSFAVLFFELIVIRWSSSEIRALGFFKNIMLMAVLVGLGLGCSKPLAEPEKEQTAQAEQQGEQRRNLLADPLVIFSTLFVIFCGILFLAPTAGLTQMRFVISSSSFEWLKTNPRSVSELGLNIIKLVGIYLLVVAMFDALGRLLGRELADKEPLPAYSVNLLGSLLGTLAFSLVCFLQTNPVVWVAVGFVSIAIFSLADAGRRVLFGIAACSALLLAWLTVDGSSWSPYYRIDHEAYMSSTAQPFRFGEIVNTNHGFLCRTANLSAEFIKLHPEILQSKEYLHYNLPYVLLGRPANVLIIGAGAGNDVAAAVRAGCEHIDAVEIDPAVADLGARLHPEHPYQQPNVKLYIDDARAFINKTAAKYDLVAFSYLDSHTAFSTASAVRLDNYLYTREALRAASEHLSPNGIGILSFGAGTPWIKNRLYQLVLTAHHGPNPPVFLDTGFDASGISIVWGPGLESVRPKLLETYGKLIVPAAALGPPEEITTDDWPFLYQKTRELPLLYVGVLGMLSLISYVLIFMRFRLTPRQFVQNGQFFLLGSGFLLLETRALLAVALLYGSTWLVNSVVFAIVLLMALIANTITSKVDWINERYAYAGVFATLLLLYFFPLHILNSWPVVLKFVGSLILIGLPFLCAGLIFSRAFSKTSQPQVVLGINILGALLGGCLEYTSLLIGSNNLIVLAGAVYLGAFCFASSGTSSSSPSSAK